MIGVVIGTGPSLAAQIDDIKLLQQQGAWLFGVNNTFEDFDLDVWIACDPAWHKHYGQVNIRADCWHWDKDICDQYGYKYIEGRWVDGVAPHGSDWLSLNHGSGPQALNLAVLYGCAPILLVGHDMRYEGKRHYFDGLSDSDGEYPGPLRKYSEFEKPVIAGKQSTHPKTDGIMGNYRNIAEQKGLPQITNCTPDSAMTWFPMGNLKGYLA